MPESAAKLVSKGIARVIDDVLIRHFGRDKMGYILVLHPLATQGMACYASNINRRDAIRIIKEVDKQLRRSPHIQSSRMGDRSGGKDG